MQRIAPVLQRIIARIRKQPVVTALLCTAVLACIFYLAGGLGGHRPEQAHREQVQQALTKLTALEERPVPDLGSAVPTNANAANPEMEAPDLASLQEILLSHYGEYDYNAENFRRWFSDAAIVGDSLAYAIHGFEWLNDVNIQADVGISFYTCEDVIASTEWLQPGTIFLTFSANNLLAYNEYIDAYISDYTDLITRLQTNVPGAQIYVQAILQCDPLMRDELWYYQYRDEYNLRMQTMCQELGVHYFDPNFILDGHPDIYSEDGYHPMWPFYPLWLTYMAEVGGLTDMEIS